MTIAVGTTTSNSVNYSYEPTVDKQEESFLDVYSKLNNEIEESKTNELGIEQEQNDETEVKVIVAVESVASSIVPIQMDTFANVVQVITTQQSSAIEGINVVNSQSAVENMQLVQTDDQVVQVLDDATKSSGFDILQDDTMSEQVDFDVIKIEEPDESTEVVNTQEVKESALNDELMSDMNSDTDSFASDSETEPNIMNQQVFTNSLQTNAEKFETNAIAKPSTITVDESNPVRFMEDVLEQVEAHIQKHDEGRLEIQLNPQHLGKIDIDIIQNGETTEIAIRCYESKTLELLGNQARVMGDVMEQHLGTPTVVFVDHKENDYLNQQNQQHQQNHNNEESENHQKKDTEDGSSFLQQLRLGLV